MLLTLHGYLEVLFRSNRPCWVVRDVINREDGLACSCSVGGQPESGGTLEEQDKQVVLGLGVFGSGAEWAAQKQGGSGVGSREPGRTC